MLRNWKSHEEYQNKLLEDLKLLSENDMSRVVSMDKPLSNYVVQR